jgi:hypothetical protein
MKENILYKMLKYPMNDWLLKNTIRKSWKQWIYKDKIYEDCEGLDNLREIWLKEIT